MMKGGEDRPVIVTGAASGIGQATATELRRQGARIIGVDLRDANIIATSPPPTVERKRLPKSVNGRRTASTRS